MARSSSDDSAIHKCTSGFADHLCFHIMALREQNQRRRYVWSSSPGGGTSQRPRRMRRGEVCYPRLPCWIWRYRRHILHCTIKYLCISENNSRPILRSGTLAQTLNFIELSIFWMHLISSLRRITFVMKCVAVNRWKQQSTFCSCRSWRHLHEKNTSALPKRL